MMTPPVGKSGPGSTVMSSSVVASGLSMSMQTAAGDLARLWGGMLVAMPTAMPEEPLTRRLGNLDGRTDGSVSDSS
jgi:hypothetical protein